MQRATLDLWVGLFVVAGIGALVILAMKVGNLGSFTAPETYRIYADFDNIGGLKSRAPVKSAGVVVGRVGGIQFDTQTYKARVALDVEKQYPFSKDTAAAILTSGLLGEQYVGLETGADSAMLQDQDRISLTQSAVVLERLIGQFIYGKAEGGGAKPEAAIVPQAAAEAVPPANSPVPAAKEAAAEPGNAPAGAASGK
jgi:phospholipid/cholesterol/gamma-HCH transport system substrate-binding protein